MHPFINSPEEAAALVAEAKSWVGTPYAADGAVKGTGVSCSMLPYAILADCGLVLPPPPRRGTMLKIETLPAMLGFMLAHTGNHFEAVDGLGAIRAGDVALFDAGMGHMTLAIDTANMIHSWQHRGAHISTIAGAPVLKHLKGIWRPIVSD
jgi:cell wall-associated NlpC family hydrolase